MTSLSGDWVSRRTTNPLVWKAPRRSAQQVNYSGVILIIVFLIPLSNPWLTATTSNKTWKRTIYRRKVVILLHRLSLDVAGLADNRGLQRTSKPAKCLLWLLQGKQHKSCKSCCSGWLCDLALHGQFLLLLSILMPSHFTLPLCTYPPHMVPVYG